MNTEYYNSLPTYTARACLDFSNTEAEFFCSPPTLSPSQQTDIYSLNTNREADYFEVSQKINTFMARFNCIQQPNQYVLFFANYLSVKRGYCSRLQNYKLQILRVLENNILDAKIASDFLKLAKSLSKLTSIYHKNTLLAADLAIEQLNRSSRQQNIADSNIIAAQAIPPMEQEYSQERASNLPGLETTPENVLSRVKNFISKLQNAALDPTSDLKLLLFANQIQGDMDCSKKLQKCNIRKLALFNDDTVLEPLKTDLAYLAEIQMSLEFLHDQHAANTVSAAVELLDLLDWVYLSAFPTSGNELRKMVAKVAASDLRLSKIQQIKTSKRERREEKLQTLQIIYNTHQKKPERKLKNTIKAAFKISTNHSKWVSLYGACRRLCGLHLINNVVRKQTKILQNNTRLRKELLDYTKELISQQMCVQDIIENLERKSIGKTPLDFYTATALFSVAAHLVGEEESKLFKTPVVFLTLPDLPCDSITELL